MTADATDALRWIVMGKHAIESLGGRGPYVMRVSRKLADELASVDLPADVELEVCADADLTYKGIALEFA